MLNGINVLLVVLALVAQWHVLAQQLLVPAWPLAVKNPFLNTWYLAGSKPAPLNALWPNLWTSAITGWYCGIRVDGAAFRLMGDAPIPAINTSTQLSVGITPTQTIVQMQAGPVNVTMNFLSPITATDLTRQSLPFSYFSVTVASADGSPHSVQVYSDISAEWITGNTGLEANSTEDIQSDFVILETSLLQSPQPFVEINDFAQDSTSFYALKNGAGVHYQVGFADDVRSLALNSTGLQNDIDANVSSHPINNPFDVWGISADLGQITTMTSPLVWAIGVTRDPSIQFTSLSGDVQLRSSYYRMNFSTPHDMVSFFLNDYGNALSASTQLDNQITGDALKLSLNYPDLLSLVARQAMSALEITVSKNADGSFNSSDIMAFMKDDGAVGAAGANSVDVMYATFPMHLYLNPAIGGYLLKPLLVAQDTPEYTQPYAAQNLDNKFPNATMENVAHNFGIEQSGNMIIMLLAHLQASGDGSLIKQHYNMVKGWADYLVQNSLNPGAQQPSPSDGITAVNQTNLALKGIIGIGAMSKISSFMGMSSDASTYGSTAQSYIGQWQNLSISQDKTHLMTSFGQQASAGLIYNLYADKLLQLDLVPQSVYDLQTSYYIAQLASSKFGIPLDNKTPNVTRADWMMFAAAASSDDNLRSSLISLVHSYAFTPSTNTPISPIYNPTSGSSPGGINSPSMGALFSVLALNKPLQMKIAGSSLGASTTSKKSKAGAIAGGVIAGVACLGLLGFGIFYYMRFIQGKKRGSALYYDGTGGPFSYADRIERVKPSTNLTQAVLEPFVVQPLPSESYVSSEYVTADSKHARMLSYSAPTSEDSLTSPRSDSYFSSQASSSQMSESYVGRVGQYTVQNPEGGDPDSRGTTSRRGPLPPIPAEASGSRETMVSAHVAVASKQQAVHDDLRNEVDNLRREIELIREERVTSVVALGDSEAPPSYDGAIAV